MSQLHAPPSSPGRDVDAEVPSSHLPAPVRGQGVDVAVQPNEVAAVLPSDHLPAPVRSEGVDITVQPKRTAAVLPSNYLPAPVRREGMDVAVQTKQASVAAGSRLRSFLATLFSIRELFTGKPPQPRHWVALTCWLVMGCLAVILGTFCDYGITWDEHWQAVNGDHIINWYTSGFVNRRATNDWNLVYYGGFFDVTAQLASRLSPRAPYEARHLVNACFGVLGVVGAYLLGRELAGPRAGFLAALLLALTPCFYGHSFNNPKDIPFASLFILALYHVVKAVRCLPRIPFGLTIKLGVTIGLTLAIRIGGVFLLGYLGLAFCLWALLGRTQTPTLPLRSAIKSFLGPYLAVCAIAYVMMLAWWPAAQVRPYSHPLLTLWKAARFDWSQEVFFEGKMIPAPDLPRYYVLKWFLITLPEFLFLALAVGVVVGALTLLRGRRAPLDRARLIGCALLIIAVSFPLTAVTAGKSIVYDGMRHFLFLVPSLAVLAGLALDGFLSRVSSLPGRALVLLPLGGSMALTLFDMIELHPYQTVYFNRAFAEGLPGAARLYETDYWGNSYREGIQWLAAHYPDKPDGRRIRVATASYHMQTSYYLPPDRFEFVGCVYGKMTDQPDVYLATPRWGYHNKLHGRVIHVVTRQDTPLLYVIEVVPQFSPSESFQ